MPRNAAVKIDKEFKALLGELAPEEAKALEDSLLANGCLDPLKVWKEEGVLLDGHNRYELCKKHGIDYEVEYVSLPDRDAALMWMVEFQTGRRSWNDEQRAYFRGKEYLLKLRQPAAEPSDNDGDDAGTNGHVGKRTAEVLGEKYGVTGRTILRDADYASALDKMAPTKREAVLKGDTAVTRAEVIKKYKKPKETGARTHKKKKPGQFKFPWGEFDKVFGRLRRATDEIATAHDCKGCNEHRSANKLLADYMDKVGEWRERLERKAAEKE